MTTAANQQSKTAQRVTLTKSIAYASAQDYANARMRAAGRSVWNREDADRAANATLHYMVLGGHLPIAQALQCGYSGSLAA